jgi:hypothetical protein
MSDAKKPAPTAGEKVVEAEIAAHLTAFERHRKELLDLLRDVYERRSQTKPFDENYSWRNLRFMAYAYLRRKAEVSQKRARMPAGDRAKLLRQLGNALRIGRRKADEAMKTVRGHWFVEWAEANGNPDFTDPIISRFEEEFEKRVADLVGLETAAFRAAETARNRDGRPPGTGVLPHDFIIPLASVYRDITKANSGAGDGPFAGFVWEFLTALGRADDIEYVSVIDAIKDARLWSLQRSEREWGSSPFDKEE